MAAPLPPLAESLARETASMARDSKLFPDCPRLEFCEFCELLLPRDQLVQRERETNYSRAASSPAGRRGQAASWGYILGWGPPCP